MKQKKQALQEDWYQILNYNPVIVYYGLWEIFSMQSASRELIIYKTQKERKHFDTFALSSDCKRRLHLVLTSVKFRIKSIEVFGIKFILNDTEGFTESLEVNDLTGTQESDRFTDIGFILYQSEDIIICGSCLLFCCIFANTNNAKLEAGQSDTVMQHKEKEHMGLKDKRNILY